MIFLLMILRNGINDDYDSGFLLDYATIAFQKHCSCRSTFLLVIHFVLSENRKLIYAIQLWLFMCLYVLFNWYMFFCKFLLNQIFGLYTNQQKSPFSDQSELNLCDLPILHVHPKKN